MQADFAGERGCVDILRRISLDAARMPRKITEFYHFLCDPDERKNRSGGSKRSDDAREVKRSRIEKMLAEMEPLFDAEISTK
jgi:hypothetical protein